MQLQRPPFSASTLHRNFLKRHWVIPQEVARCVRVHTASSIRAADFKLTKQKLNEACRNKSTPPDQVLAFLAEIEDASKTSSQVQSTFVYFISLPSCYIPNFSSHFPLTLNAHASEACNKSEGNVLAFYFSTSSNLLARSSLFLSDFPEILNGTWRLVFAVPAPIPAWSYIPVIENVIIDVAEGTIKLQSYLGPATFTFTGAATFTSSPANNVYDMIFSFNACEIAVFGKSWKSQREPKQKTYSFFLAEQQLAAVNSRATGGKTLMLRQ